MLQLHHLCQKLRQKWSQWMAHTINWWSNSSKSWLSWNVSYQIAIRQTCTLYFRNKHKHPVFLNSMWFCTLHILLISSQNSTHWLLVVAFWAALFWVSRCLLLLKSTPVSPLSSISIFSHEKCPIWWVTAKHWGFVTMTALYFNWKFLIYTFTKCYDKYSYEKKKY